MVPQLILLIVFGLLIAGGLGITTAEADFAKVLRNTNLANLVVWSYWWPLIVAATVLFGRLWCMVCPMELVSSLAVRVGLRRKAPRILRSGWVITAFYMLILIVGIHTFALHRIPQRMAIYMLTLLGSVLVVSLIWEKRAFCSYVCPVGHLLGLYALVSLLEWRVKDSAVCRSCPTKECIAAKNRYKIVGRSCTSDLYPATIKDNQDCLLCTQCLKVCPHGNIRFSVRKPFADFFSGIVLNPAQVAFVLAVSGFIAYEILSEWSNSKAILTWLPDHINSTLAITGQIAGFSSAVIMFLMFPAILLVGVIMLAKLRSSASVGTIITTFALLLIPTMASAHLIKAMFKMTSRIPYWPYVFFDPAGVETAQRILDKSLVLDTSVPDALHAVVSITSAGLLLTALVATVLILRKTLAVGDLDAGAGFSVILGVMAYWSVFSITILLWRF